ncbi:MAG: amidohydrolase family protein [Actinomycetota bacterium]|nr:amidohydrolase family protein [Actinomycetota bacterium]
MILSASVVLPVTSPPIYEAGILVQDDQIVEIDSTERLLKGFPKEEHLHLKDCALLPGLVNLHSHLEYSFFSDICRPTAFLPWLQRLIKRSDSFSDDDWVESARFGARKMLQAGITCVADITRTGAGAVALRETGLRGISYLELVGVGSSDVSQEFERFEDKLRELSSLTGGGLTRMGVSPHSIYTLSEEALRAVRGLVDQNEYPVTIHLAETAYENELVRCGSGPFRVLSKRFGLPFAKNLDKFHSVVEYLEDLGLLSERTLAAHCVHLSDEDLKLLKKAKATIVTCPTSNQMLRVGQAPVDEFLRWEIPFGVGTDSLASNPGFDLFSEVRKSLKPIQKNEGNSFDFDLGLRILTLEGAKILKFDNLIGSLEKGKKADIIAVKLPSISSDGQNLSRELYSKASSEEVKMVMINGRMIVGES